MMKKTMVLMLALVFMCSSMLILASCAKKHIGVSQEGAATTTQEKQATEKETPKKDTTVAKKADTGAKGEKEDDYDARKLRTEISVFESEHIYFDFDKSELKSLARQILKKKADWLIQNPGYSLRIEGHCDERGTNEYNLALGERRANAAWKFLNALGVSGDRMTTISYGEERPDVPGHDEQAWSMNRRDEFKIIK